MYRNTSTLWAALGLFSTAAEHLVLFYIKCITLKIYKNPVPKSTAIQRNCLLHRNFIFVKCMVSNYSKGIYCWSVHRKEALITPTQRRAKLRQWGANHTTGVVWGVSLCVSTHPLMTWSHATAFWHDLSFTRCTRRMMPVKGTFTWSYVFSSLLHLWPFCTLRMLLWRVIYFHVGFSAVPLSKALDCFAKTNYFGQHLSQVISSFSKCWVQE